MAHKISKLNNRNNITPDSILSFLRNEISPDRIAGKHKIQYVKAANAFAKELKAYLNFLHEFEQLVINEKINKKALQKDLNSASNRIVYAGNMLEKAISSFSLKKETKDKFRECIGKWAYQSQIIKRSFEKPLGYAGDCKIIEMFYDQKPMSNDLGYYFDRYILSNALATADIYRKDKIKELLKDFIENSGSLDLDILNVGCGSCREIKELFFDYLPSKNIKFVCVDQELEALKFIKKFSNKLPSNVSVNFVRRNVIDLIKEYKDKEGAIKSLSQKQLVYSIGLVDYFADNVLKLFVRFCLKCLDQGGQLIFAHKNKHKNKSFLPPDWFCDWNFYERDRNEVLKIIKDEIVGCDLKIVWEKTKHMFFLIITKNNRSFCMRKEK